MSDWVKFGNRTNLCIELWAGSPILKTVSTTVVIMAIGSLAFTCIELHAQSNSLVVVEAPNAPVLVLRERGALCFFLYLNPSDSLSLFLFLCFREVWERLRNFGSGL